MTTTAQQIRAYRGPALLSLGLRPFFLGAAIWAALIILIWLPVLWGMISLPSEFSPVAWHSHELIFGYLPAVMTGFLLTAIPNWTGRLPVVGMPLLGLFGLWLAGRVAIVTSAWIGAPLAAVIDLSFLALVALVMAREIISSNNTRSLRLLAIVILMLGANALFHAENVLDIGDGYGFRMGIAAGVMLIMIIGGRVVPSFTRNWLARNRPENEMPIPFDKFDGVAIAAAAIGLASWVVWPLRPVTALLFVGAFAIHLMRLSRWQGIAARAEPIVSILHVAYLFVPLGFLLLSFSILFPEFLAQSGALHAWTAGAIGLMTLAIMTRASLGHSGRVIKASKPIVFIYLMAIVAVISRLIAAFDFMPDVFLQISVIGWVAAFAGFAVVYWPVLVRPRL